MKEVLLKKQEELQKSLEKLQKEAMNIQEQIVMHRGALQYNEILLKELETKETKSEAEG
jgi:small-conductance mechanosensitive channel